VNKIVSDARNTPLYGCVTVTLDSEDVTKDCQIADEVNGTVTLLKRNGEGKLYVEGDDVATEQKSGVVVISLRDDAPDSVKKIYAEMRGDE
jgi:hypothetical protein